jgi:DNA-binding transcriptional ArsR family regulator
MTSPRRPDDHHPRRTVLATVNISPVEVMSAIAALQQDHVAMLASYLTEGETQRQIGERTGRSQPTVSRAIRSAAAVLRTRGLVIPLPGRGRRKGRTCVVDPAALGRLTVSEPTPGLPTRGTWLPSR